MKYFACMLLMVSGQALGQPLDEILARWDRDQHTDLRSVLVMRDGAIVAERYYNGETNGKRIISASCLEAALAPRVAIGDVDPYADHYGYFWYQKTHRVGDRDIRVHFASGNGGNKIYVIPALNTVVAITSSAYGKGYGQRRSANILAAILEEIK